ncbi:A disintegrin and metalloproteinase with thrombospondin motifs 19-like [Saccostrea echinata]|uniref:A disintegrin and metalloproteinase with thrombospondin motifs 19-like n=1 Tax=Saccostrea echinata TaxID=191078 RepID=UPI002A7EB51E|nr:A disintegrin and metalloproteinase with thrombospondin motifs 19-like [Saccostrea echinata]
MKIPCMILVPCTVYFIYIIFYSENEKTTETGNATRYSRQKRQYPLYNYTLDLLIVVDPGVVDWFKSQSRAGTPERIKEEAYNETKLHYYRVFNGIKKRFITSQEIGINLDLVDITLAENISFPSPVSLTPDPRSLIPAPAVLDAFRDWINNTELRDHDHALLFTGYNLTYGGSASSKGLSFPDSVCTELAMSVVEEFYDERTAIYAAQELGRSLGSRLDMDGNFCRSTNLNIMSTKFVFNSPKISNLWKFSRCSKSYIKDFLQKLDSDESHCLRSPSDEVIPTKVLPTPDADNQCKTAFGSDSFLCRAVIGTDYRVLCGGMPCFLPKSTTCSRILPLDGTLCGNYSVCQEGECKVSSSGKNVQDQCPFGDQPVLPDGVGCSDRVYGRPFDCYLPSFNAACCQTCEEIKTDIEDCEYGDRIDRCQYPKCPTYNNFTRENLCCLTCKNGKSPYSASTDAPLSTTSSDSVFYVTSDEKMSTENGTSLISTTTPKPSTTTESTSLAQLSTRTETQTTESTALTDLTSTLISTALPTPSTATASTSLAPLSTRTESDTTESSSSTDSDKQNQPTRHH